MTTNLTNDFSITSEWNHSNENPDSTPRDKNSLAKVVNYTFGTGAADLANDQYYARFTLSSSSSTVDIDLQAVSNFANQTLVLTAVKLVWIRNLTETTGDDIQVGAALTNAFSGPFNGSTTAQVTVPPGGDWLAQSPVDGFTVSGTNKVLRLTYDGSASEINAAILVIGER